MPDSIVVAIGGNATHPESIKGTTEEQEVVADKAARALLPLIRGDNRLLITHGNGPVVGKILMRMMMTKHAIPPMRLDVCVAHSQGGIGYLLLQALENLMQEGGMARPVACIVTQVEVDADDPAFQNPSKPIGPFFSREEAADLEAKGWRMMEDAGRGWRHCVPSPEPRGVLNLGMVKTLLDTGAIVIAGGGGGIPVVRGSVPAVRGARGWQGREAVIDKDLTSALLARSLGLGTLLLLTAVERVALGFGTPRQRALHQVSVSELKAHQRAGEFSRGSMGPKIEAAIRHVEAGGKRAVIAHLEQAGAAFAGDAGTHVLPG